MYLFPLWPFLLFPLWFVAAFSYKMPRYGFIYIYPAQVLKAILNLLLNVFHQFWKVFILYLKILLMFLSLLCF